MPVLFTAFVTLLFTQAPITGQPGGEWRTFHDPTLGFSLRYPPALEVSVSKSPQPVEAPNPNALVDLVTREIDPDRPHLGLVKALRIAVLEHGRVSPPHYRETYRNSKGFRDTTVGGRSAGRITVCGRAACSWVVVVYGSRELSISSMDPDESEKRGPDDTRYPLQSIINSITFDSSFPK